jgi:hypothetical protein
LRSGMAHRMAWLAFISSFALGIGLLAGCGAFRPHGVVSNVNHEEHPELINGNLDWGSEVSCDVSNQSVRGTIHITVTLSSSEGQWTRTQDLLLDQGQSMHLTYFFQEPTINASNYQAVVSANP